MSAEHENTNDEVQQQWERLSPDARREALEFMKFLEQKDVPPKDKPGFSFKWAGGLKHLRDQYTSDQLLDEVSRSRG